MAHRAVALVDRLLPWRLRLISAHTNRIAEAIPPRVTTISRVFGMSTFDSDIKFPIGLSLL